MTRRPAPVAWGDLRRREPFSRAFGFDRGQPVDRYYIERFLDRHRDDIRGRVLEVGDAGYTHRFGGDRVERSDVYDLPGRPGATLSGDLGGDSGLPAAAFDCMIVTQTLLFVFDLQRAAANLAAALAPAGALLLTVPGISAIVREDMDTTGDFWRFTTRSVERLFSPHLSEIEVRADGNVIASVAFLEGLSAHELAAQELDHHDPDYQLLIALRGVRAPA